MISDGISNNPENPSKKIQGVINSLAECKSFFAAKIFKYFLRKS